MQIFGDFLNFSGFYLKVNHGAKGIPNAKKMPTKIKNSIGLNPNTKENIYQRERECFIINYRKNTYKNR
ncbi:hypothetical protein [Ligilactobacillus salivarius]|uniref:hypothetical protein n=1 Tax=Ligilactobacillus salivarius TaxID=1624 RepID=UPI00237E9DE9|nr:hypothetical protein [Ligilactobacillus salivarius]MDE1542777.1 hypothetical protein [Ligilactobacillus salivarius]